MSKPKPKTEPNKEIELLQEKLVDAEVKWKRALADYQNLEKRTAEQKAVYLRLANVSLIEKILGVADDLDRASSHIKDEGLKLITARLDNILKEEGLVEIPAENLPFDPTTMECVEVVEGAKEQVVRVVQKGFKLYDSIIRPAKVEVGKGEVNNN